MKKITLSIGLLKQDMETQIDSEKVKEFVIRQMSKQGVDGATFIQGTGVWKGEIEPSLIVEFIDDTDLIRYNDIAESVAERFEQEAVMVTKTSCQMGLIEPSK